MWDGRLNTITLYCITYIVSCTSPQLRNLIGCKVNLKYVLGISADSVTVTSPKGYNYKYIEYNVQATSSIVVQIKGAAKACIGLFAGKPTSWEEEEFYETIIGRQNNRMIALRTKPVR